MKQIVFALFGSLLSTVAVADGLQGAKRPAFTDLLGLPGLVFAQVTDLTCITDQSAILQAEATRAGVGGTVVVPAGCIKIGANTITAPAAQRWIFGGLGSGLSGFNPTAGTQIQSNRSSGIDFKLPGFGSSMSGFYATNTVAGNAATFLQIGNGENQNQKHVDDAAVDGYDIGIDIYDGAIWSLNNVALNNSRCGLQVRNTVNADHGDSNITRSVFTGNVTAICYKSGGGLKISQTKILGGTDPASRGIVLEIPDGAATSDFVVNDTVSIELTNAEAIKLGRPAGGTTGTFGNIVLAPQIASRGNGITIGPGISRVVIPPSAQIASDNGNAVLVTGGSDMRIAPTVYSSALAAISITGGTGISADVRGVNTAVNGVLLEDLRGSFPSIQKERSVKDYTRVVTIASNTTTYTSLFTMQPQAYSGGDLEVVIEGVVGQVGQYAYSAKYLVSRGSQGSTVTAIGTAATAGAAFEVAIDTSDAVNGVVLVKARMTTGTGTDFNGTATVRRRGRDVTFGYAP